MSSNWSTGTNTIKEVDTNKNLTCQMFKVRKQGGGTEYLVRKSDVALGTKSVTQNGTYTAAADDKYGFSQFSVNVRGGNGSADSHGKPTGGDIKPGGAGSAVVGTDPETGNDVVVGVDEEDNLVKTPLPSSIVLVTNPTKMDYNDGETIDLSGAVVVAKMANGTTWTDADHPNGHVSCTPEPYKADASQAGGDDSKSYDGVSVVYATGNSVTIQSTTSPWVKESYTAEGSGPIYKYGVYATIEYAGGSIGAYLCSPNSFTSNGTVRTYTLNGKTCYFTGRMAQQDSFAPEVDAPLNDIRSVGPDGEYGLRQLMPWIVCYGEDSGRAGAQTITLNWARPGDGKVLSTTMEINVGAHTTESSSGTEGSGGGGSF